jgi:hypothetical protein
MAYKYESILKTFEYSKDSYKIISDFLLSGDITNPNVMLNVTKVSKEFGKIPKDWLRMSSTVAFIKALILIKIEENNKVFIKAFKKWLKSDGRKSPIGQNSDFIDVLEMTDYRELLSLSKEIGLIMVKKGGANSKGEALQGTWIHKDLAIEYARWLDPKFSIWVSQKILDLVSDGVAWNKIRLQTRTDYKPLTDAIEKHIRPKYPKMQDNILFGQIANYINCRVMKQKAKDIRLAKGIDDSELTRDYFQKLEFERIEEVQVYAKILIVQLKIHDFKKLEEMILEYEF